MENAEAYQVLQKKSGFKEKNRLFLLLSGPIKVSEPRIE
jgi:hypothetical protein